jgi:hypothetical protein
MPIPKGSYLVIDRGYHDFEEYNMYINNNIRFVTRMKTTPKYMVVKTCQINSNSPVLSDEIIELFFKKIKQNLKIKWFFGRTRNTLLTQIWIAMDACLMTVFLNFYTKKKFQFSSYSG